jgi:DNA-binding CsgD family transcriptional regulator
MAPEGFEDSSSASVERAVRRLLRMLYAGMDIPAHAVNDFVPTKEDRNREIYQRYMEGVRAVELARQYSVSLQRIYTLIRRQNRR